MNEKYEKIINFPHHVSEKRTPMVRGDRAAQFAPYSALSGYEDAVEETARITDKKIELDEYEKERVNSALLQLLDAPLKTRATVTYFRPDGQKSGGEYVDVSGELAHIDEIKRTIVLVGGHKIPIDDILDLRIS